MLKSPFMNPLKSKSILVPTFRSLTLIDPYDVTYIKAMQNYCMLYKQDGSQLLTSISFGKILDGVFVSHFYQCHRSFAVRLSCVNRYLNSGMVELNCGAKVPVSRRKKREFLEVVRNYVPIT